MTVREETMRRVDAPPMSRTESQVLLGAAGSAPSVLNAQPWTFEIRGRTIDVYVDQSRALGTSVDPSGRLMAISCGAALFNLRVAAAYLGREVTVRLKAERAENPGDCELLASVRLGQRARANTQDAALFPAVRRRHAQRRLFAPRAVPGSVLFELTQCVHTERAVVVPVSRTQRTWLFDLIEFAETMPLQSANHETDLRKWTANGLSRVDGVRTRSVGSLADSLSGSLSGTSPMRAAAAAHGVAQPAARYAPDPWTAILATAADDKIAWLQAGQALQRLLLTSSMRGLAVSFLNQPLDDPTIRHELITSGLGAFPQIVLRMGYGIAESAAPVDDLVRRRSRKSSPAGKSAS